MPGVFLENEGLPDGWKAVRADDGDVYYWNEATNETLWERPGVMHSIVKVKTKT